jgi:hypothetical protein
MGQRKTISLGLNRGQWSGGDPALMAEGYCRKVRNMLLRPNRWSQRPPFTYDNVATSGGRIGLALWNDGSYNRLIAMGSGGAYVKATSGETWTLAGSTLNPKTWDHTNHNGSVYAIMSGTFQQPYAWFWSYNGTSVDYPTLGGGTSGTLDGSLQARSLTAFKSRLFIGGVSLYFQNQLGYSFGTDPAYDPTDWTLTNVTAETITSGSTVTGRVTPTNTTTAKMSALFAIGAFNDFTWLCPLRGTHPSYRMPVTLSVKYGNAWVTNDYDAGDIVVPTTANDYRYRCTVAGTAGGVEPVWPTVVGTTIVDGGVTWICEGSDVVVTTQQYVPTATESSAFKVFVLQGSVPDGAFGYLRCEIKFTHGSAITLAGVDFSYKDGLTEGAPNKANYQQQVTTGSFIYPMGQDETDDLNTVYHTDYIYWTEIAQTQRIRATNFIRLTDAPGAITAIRPVQGRLVAFKRNAAWVFSSTDDPDFPIIPDGDAKIGFGCLGPKALDVFEDIAYFIGENEIYSWDLSGAPVPLCGDAMREEIMSKASATWVESQATYNTPLLRVDQKNRELWVYTQKGRLYVYDLDEKAWSVHDAGGDTSVNPTGYEVADMLYNPNTGHMYFAFGTAAAGTAGVARLDPTVTDAEDSISTSGTLPVYSEIWPRPIETSGPRADVLVEAVRFHHAVTSSQTSQTTTAAVSFDHGQTFTKTNQVTLDPVSTGEYRPMEVALYQSWGSCLVRLLHAGKGGANSFNVSQCEVDVQVERGEYRKDNPTAGSASL